MIDTKHTLDRAGAEVLDACIALEGIAAALTALASDMDGAKQINSLQAARAIELLVTCCNAVQHRLGLAHELIEDVTTEGEEGRDANP